MSLEVARAGVLLASLAYVGCAEYVELGDNCPGSTCALDAGFTLDAALEASRCGTGDASSCACELGATGLLAHWPLDEQAGAVAHEVVSGRDGVLQHASSQSPWVAGEIGGALSFDGSDDVVFAGAIAGSTRSVSFWLAPRTTQLASSQTPMQLPTAHGPLDEWMHPELAYADDNMSATVASLIGTKAQHWGGFHLSQLLPPQATILGITVTIDTGNIGLLGALSVELSWDGGNTHTSSNYAWGQLIVGSNLRQAGGADKLWGRTWSAADFTDANFRVRADFGGIANAMSLNYLGVEIQYAQQTLERAIVGLTANEYLAFSGSSVEAVGWTGTSYVNGAVNGALMPGWNHVAFVGKQGLTAADVRLGWAAFDSLVPHFDGLLDDVILFSDALTPAQITGLSNNCSR